MLPPFIRANTRMRFLSGTRLSGIWPWCIAAGITVVAFLPQLYLLQWLGSASLLLLLLWVWPTVRPLSGLFLLCVTGAIWGTIWGQLNLNRTLPVEIVKQDVRAIGKVMDLPRQGSRTLRFRFNITSLAHQGKPIAYAGPVLLNCYRPCPPFQAGQQWQLSLRLKPAHGSLNPGGFDYAQWLFSEGIRATGYVREPGAAVLLNNTQSGHRITQLRAAILQFISAQQLSYGGLLAALSVGVRDGISDSQWRVFRRTGTAHLVAISGLHIGMVAAITLYLAHILWRHSLLRHTQIPAQTIARVAAIVAAALYAALAGFALPTLRALLMLLAYFLLLTLRRNPGTLFTLGFVLLVVLIFDPLAPLGAGLWLSFVAVAAIAMVSRTAHVPPETQPDELAPPGQHAKLIRWFLQWWRIQLAIFIGLMPLSLVFFQQFSLLSMLANFIAIPLMAVLVVPLLLLAMSCLVLSLPAVAAMLLNIANTLVAGLWPVLQSLSELPLSIQVAPAPGLWTLALSISAVILMLSPSLGKLRLLGILGLLPLLINPRAPGEPGSFRIQLLDVGQGLAVVVQTRKHVLLYDAGIRYPDGFDAGRAIVIPFLRQQNVRHIDAAVISHDNLDHYGGIAAVMQEFPADSRFSAAGFYPSSKPCQRGQSWEWDGVQFRFLHPQAGNMDDDNNASCVLKVSSRFGSALLTGDIERQAELDLLENAAPDISNIDVLFAGHHGSKTSSIVTFIEAVDPYLTVTSSGYLNRFKHPHPQIVQRYRDRNIPLLNTAGSGWISLVFDASGIVARPWRAHYQRYWLQPIDGVSLKDVKLQPHHDSSRAKALPPVPHSKPD